MSAEDSPTKDVNYPLKASPILQDPNRKPFVTLIPVGSYFNLSPEAHADLTFEELRSRLRLDRVTMSAEDSPTKDVNYPLKASPILQDPNRKPFVTLIPVGSYFNLSPEAHADLTFEELRSRLRDDVRGGCPGRSVTHRPTVPDPPISLENPSLPIKHQQCFPTTTSGGKCVRPGRPRQYKQCGDAVGFPIQNK
ncbi:hypothetical protein J6590_076475 [Homalodisca vitripennis]|nr:hypothetical protein J6590_076475 [Homalodisca vitripennis]